MKFKILKFCLKSFYTFLVFFTRAKITEVVFRVKRESGGYKGSIKSLILKLQKRSCQFVKFVGLYQTRIAELTAFLSNKLRFCKI